MASAVDLNALTVSLSSWEFAGYIAVAAVAIGVAGEVIHDFTRWFKSSFWWQNRGNRASALLLVFALVAELVIQVKANSISGRIIAALNNEAADALDRAGKLGITVDNLTDVTRRKTASADAAITALNAATAAAEKKLEDLQERQTQRHLKPEEIKALVDVLSEFPGQKSSVSCLVSDGETCSYAEDFLTVLKQAQWVLVPDKVTPVLFAGGDVQLSNVQICFNKGEKEAGHVPPAVWPFVNTLLRLHLVDSRTAFVNPENPVGVIEVRVGPRSPLKDQ